jgi:sortase (surface protein transpeptidase)
VVQAAYPATPSAGTTYVYGHACHHHLCPFTLLTGTDIGDTVVVTTPSGLLTYRVDRIGLSPKSASSLPTWASDSTVGNRIVLVTCQYEHGDTSTTNIVVVANLTSAIAS